MLHSIHGGPHSASGDTFHYRWNNQLFAAQGYVVACVNYHGSSGFGNAFLDSITHRWGELELKDVEAATDWLRKQPWVDKKRIFATGGSYGGFMVAWMNGHVKPGRYQAYVCHAGCFDWRAMYADDAYTWHSRELGANYWDDPAKIQSQSPDTFAAPIRDADARDPRRARLPRARPAGPGLLQHPQGAQASMRGWSGSRTRTTGSSSRATRASGTASSSPG